MRALSALDAIFLFVSLLTLGLPRIWDWYWKVVFLSIAPVLFGLLHTFRCVNDVKIQRLGCVNSSMGHLRWDCAP